MSSTEKNDLWFATLLGQAPRLFLSILLLFALKLQVLHAQETFHIVLDPGHGGPDFGVNHHGFLEKTLALQVAKKAEELLQNRPGISAVLTRQGDYGLSFDERRNIANSFTNGVFVSLHFGASPDDKIRATKIFILKSSQGFDESARLASLMKEELFSVCSNSEAKTAKFPLTPLIGISIPAILIELDTLTYKDTSNWLDPSMADKASKLIISALDRFIAKRKDAVP